MFTRPIRPLVIAAARLQPALRSQAQPARFVSGYGSAAQQGKAPRADSVPGSVVPEYSGPSIAEKKSGSAVQQDIEAERNGMSEESQQQQPMRDEQNGAEWKQKQRKQAKEKMHEGKDEPNVKRWSNSAQSPQKREFHSSALRSDRVMDDLKDDASRMLDSTKNSMLKGAIDVKESLSSVTHSAKKAMRHAKENLKDAAATLTEPVYDSSSRKEDLYPTSDSANSKGWRAPGAASPEVEAERSGAALGESVNAVRKSLFDGPQDMPQGVGKRAKNERGEDMETGAPRT